MLLCRDGIKDNPLGGPGLALEKLRVLDGNEEVDLIPSQGPDVIRTRLDALMQFEYTLIGQVHDHLASAIPTLVCSHDKNEEPYSSPTWLDCKYI